MPSFLDQQVFPPDSWEEFEKLCADLWGKIWNDPNTQMHGRSGQAQQGIDVYGQKNGNGDWLGVQCKGKDGRYGQAVSEKELRDEVAKAKKFEHKLSQFILATTAPNDAKIQKIAREITEAHGKPGLFKVVVMGWSEIHRRLANYPELIDKYYPGQGPQQSRIEDQLDKISKSLIGDPDRENRRLQAFAQTSAKADEDKFKTELVESGLGDQKESASSILEKSISDEIDGYRDLLLNDKPCTALTLLVKLKDRVWDNATNWIKFRILTNIAAAYFNQQNHPKAVEHFLSAFYFAPKDEKALCNRALAYHISGENQQAKESIDEALGVFPESKLAYSILISIAAELEEVDPVDQIPEKALESSEVAYALSYYYRKRQQPEHARDWAKKAYDLDDKLLKARTSYAATLLGELADNQEIIYGGQWTQEQKEAAEISVNLLRDAWNELQGSEIIHQNFDTCLNLISAERLLGNAAAGIEVATVALKVFPDSLDLKKQKAVLFLELDKPQDACEFMEGLGETELFHLGPLFLDALSQANRTKDAIQWADKFIASPEAIEKDILLTKALKIDLLFKEEGGEVAHEAVNALLDEYPDSVFTQLIAVKLFVASGASNAAQIQLQKMQGLLRPDSSYDDKLLVADAAYQMADYETAGRIYTQCVTSYQDSIPLQRLLICLYECDKRKDLLELLGKVSVEARALRFYRRMALATYVRIGELGKGRKEAEEYLELEPNDLSICVNWLNILIRQGKMGEVKEFLKMAPDFPHASATDQMYLAHLYDHFGYSDKAVALAYRLRLDNPDDANINLKFIGIFLLGKGGSVAEEPTEVGIGTALFLKDAKARTEQYFILDGESSGFTKNVIKPDHPIAQAAIGKKVGETFAFSLNPFQKEERVIIGIKSKYLHLLHVTMDEFAGKFPSSQGFMPVSVENPTGDGYCFDALFNSVSAKQEHTRDVLAMYASQPYPVGLIARLLGIHPLKAWGGLQADQGTQIYCCAGTYHERIKAINLIEKCVGAVLDPLTLVNICQLGVQESVLRTVGKLGVTQTGLDLILALIQDHQMQCTLDQGYSVMTKSGDQFIMHEITVEEIRANISELEAILAWAKKNCEILPAVGKCDAPPIAKQLAELMDESFTDCILAASGADWIFLCDDQRLRNMASQFWHVEGVWLQGVLLVAEKDNLIPFSHYCRVTASLMERGFNFITLDSNVLLRIVEDEKWSVTRTVKAVFAAIGEKNADLASSVRVTQEFLVALWKRPLSTYKTERLTYHILNQITDDGYHRSCPAMLVKFTAIGTIYLPEKKAQLFQSALQRWAIGHFLIGVPGRLDFLPGRNALFKSEKI